MGNHSISEEMFSCLHLDETVYELRERMDGRDG
jgi:hypothetical protein